MQTMFEKERMQTGVILKTTRQKNVIIDYQFVLG